MHHLSLSKAGHKADIQCVHSQRVIPLLQRRIPHFLPPRNQRIHNHRHSVAHNRQNASPHILIRRQRRTVAGSLRQLQCLLALPEEIILQLIIQHFSCLFSQVKQATQCSHSSHVSPAKGCQLLTLGIQALRLCPEFPFPGRGKHLTGSPEPVVLIRPFSIPAGEDPLRIPERHIIIGMLHQPFPGPPGGKQHPVGKGFVKNLVDPV